ncbi:UNVERIFIED_CONTAM: hypothetical protein GTU68_031595 [Idotea baltica]|nr:hypothetical protein [Idotea baltica]
MRSVLYPINWCDSIEILPSNSFELKCEGLTIDAKPEKNLCTKAFRLLQEKYGLPNVAIRLIKSIPMGAGLGGGSADAVSVLRLCNEMFDLKLSIEELQNYAAELGSDCPFFVAKKAAWVCGRGTDITPLELDLEEYSFLLVYPAVHISTAWAYQNVAFSKNEWDRTIISKPIVEWKDALTNDFEKAVFDHHPSLEEIKQTLYNEGAIYASMSGSGSSFFGIFRDHRQAMELQNFFKTNDYLVKAIHPKYVGFKF